MQNLVVGYGISVLQGMEVIGHFLLGIEVQSVFSSYPQVSPAIEQDGLDTGLRQTFLQGKLGIGVMHGASPCRGKSYKKCYG